MRSRARVRAGKGEGRGENGDEHVRSAGEMHARCAIEVCNRGMAERGIKGGQGSKRESACICISRCHLRCICALAYTIAY